jgi:signal transduction histidine kinase
VVTHADRDWKGYAAGGVMAAGVAVQAVTGRVNEPVTSAYDFFRIYAEEIVLLVALAALWLTAYLLRTRRLHVEALRERAATAERERDHLARLAAAEERSAIAREMHDVVAHSLAVMIVQADGASYAVERNVDTAKSALRTIAATGRDALEDMRRLVAVLRGTAPGDGGEDRRRVGLNQLETLVERARSAGLDVDLQVGGDRHGLSAADELTIFRLVQESLTNSLRHAGPGAAVTVELRFHPGTVGIVVTDDGGGKLAGAGRSGHTSGGNGLIGMRERVAVHGGEFAAGPRMGAGWQVKAVVPVRSGAPQPEPAVPAGSREPVTTAASDGPALPAAGRDTARRSDEPPQTPEAARPVAT